MSIALACLFALGAFASSADAASGNAEHPTALTVETSGFVPGVIPGTLSHYVAEQMAAAHLGNWQFLPAPGSAAPANDRVEWSFKTDPSATGAVRTYGFSRAMMERLIASRHHVTIEVKLYLHGEYQTETLGQATVRAQAPDPDLAAEIVRLTGLVMSYPSSGDVPGRIVAMVP